MTNNIQYCSTKEKRGVNQSWILLLSEISHSLDTPVPQLSYANWKILIQNSLSLPAFIRNHFCRSSSRNIHAFELEFRLLGSLCTSGFAYQFKVPSHCCDLSCNVVASCGRSGIACSLTGVVLRSHKLAIGLL